MSAAPAAVPRGDLDVFGAAVGCSIVAGVFSVLDPALVPLTATLSVLALVGWLMGVRRVGLVRHGVRRPVVLALAAFAVGGLVGPSLGASLAPAIRGPVIAGSLLPLWWVTHRGAGRSASEDGLR